MRVVELIQIIVTAAGFFCLGFAVGWIFADHFDSWFK